MRSLFLSLAVLAAAAASGCITDQSYTPIGEESEDQLCTQSNLDLVHSGTRALALDATGRATYAGSLEVTQFSRTEMQVRTEDIVVAAPAGSTTIIEIEQGALEFFTSMVFAVDVRATGSEDWEPIALETKNYDIVWFNSIEIDGAQSVISLSTLSLCSSTTIETNLSGLPSEYFSVDREFRIRAFPFDGVGDAVGVYDYDLSASVQ